MSRYIDTEKIHITANLMTDEMGEIYVSLTDVRKAIDQTPTADVVEVVRCRDCKWCLMENWDGEILYGCDCTAGLNDVEPDGFCSYGERKEK